MPKLELEKSIQIDAPPERVFAILSDLGKWRPWNPWLVTEPEAHVEVQPDGKHYRWNGKRTGSGEMRITSETHPSSVHLDVTFLKPFKSTAKVQFSIAPKDGGSVVTWGMNGSLPFFLFFMTKMMTNLIGMDYERGLTMLKDFVETGTVPSKLEFPGEAEYPGCKYVGISSECAVHELGQQMSADFEKLSHWIKAGGFEPSGDAFSIYRKWDMSAGRVKYTSGVPVAAPPTNLPAQFEVGEIPKLRTFVLNHVGAYRHLGNAWSAGMQMSRNKEFRTSKAHPPFETYPLAADGSLPGGKSDDTTLTSIHFAAK